MKNEIWKDIPDFEGSYQVSNYGRVRSVSRKWKQFSKGGSLYQYNKKGLILKPCLNAQGYPTVVLGRNHGTATVHSLVLKAFKGAPTQGLECRHKDGNRANAALKNLHYGTRLQNINDSRAHGTFEKRYAKLRHLTRKQIHQIQRYTRKPYKELARMFGVSADVIGKAVRGEYALTN